MRVLVLTSDRYLRALLPFSYLFNKYWSRYQAVVVAGFSRPDFDLPPNFHFKSLGRFEDYPLVKWSDGVIKALEEVVDDACVLMLEDYWLTRPVNTEAVNMAYDYAVQFGYVLKIDLCADRLYAWGMTDYSTCGYLDLIQSDPASQYHMSLMTGVWRKDNLLRALIPGETPWQVELEGTNRLKTMTDMLVLGTRQWPVRHTLAYRHGTFGKPDVSALAPEDVAYMTEKGWLE